MKIILYLILITTLTFAQDNSKKFEFLFGDGLEQETLVYIASLTTPLSGEQIVRINTLVVDLKAAVGVGALSQAFDVFSIRANETEEAALKNLVKRDHDATNVNSTTFTQYEGFTGNGTTMYLNTNYNPSTQGVNYKLNDASIGVYARANVSEARILMGGRTTSVTGRSYIYFSGGLQSTLNQTTAEATVASTRGDGFMAVSRISSTQIRRYIYNSVDNVASTATANSVDLTNVVLTELAMTTTTTIEFYSTNQIAFTFIGRAFTDSEMIGIRNAMEKYLDSLGKGVI
jgi:hypothetical protein